MKWARPKAGWATAIVAVALASCRFGYEQLGLSSSADGGSATSGGDGSSGSPDAGGTVGASGGAPDVTEGGAGASPNEGGAGGAGAGGVNGSAGGITVAGSSANGGAGGTTGGGGGSGGTTTGGSGGTAGAGGATGGAGGSGGTTAGSGGSAGTGGSGGTTAGSGGSGGSGGTPGVCVPNATCSCEVFQAHEYRFCGALTTRAAGLAACQSANLTLVRVDSAEENAWLLQQFLAHGMFVGAGSPVVFLGGNDTAVDGEWRWQDGTLFWSGGPVGNLYTNWSSPPKNGLSDCLGMTSDGKWVVRSGNTGNATIACESP